jgi:ubiquinone/menaquinone biosynthesis C-methylase UbiE
MGYNFSDLTYRFAITYQKLLSHNINLKGKSLLDMGAGPGENLLFAGDYGVKEAVGIDYSAERYHNFIKANLDKLNEKNLSIISYVEEDVHKQVFEDNSFDIILSSNSFEHFQDPKKVLFNIYKLCNQGGYVYIKFGPLFNSPMGAHRFGLTGVPYIQNIFPNEIVFKFIETQIQDIANSILYITIFVVLYLFYLTFFKILTKQDITRIEKLNIPFPFKKYIFRFLKKITFSRSIMDVI